jgi:hypothetical protein
VKWGVDTCSVGLSVDSDLEAEFFEAMQVETSQASGVRRVEMAGAEVSVGHPLFEHVPDRHQQAVSDGRRGAASPVRTELIGAFGTDTLNRQKLLASVTDSTVDWDLLEYGQRHYPIGRYRVVDRWLRTGSTTSTP